MCYHYRFTFMQIELFSYETFWTKARFETEAQAQSEIVYWGLHPFVTKVGKRNHFFFRELYTMKMGAVKTSQADKSVCSVV